MAQLDITAVPKHRERTKAGAPGYDPNGQKAEEGGWRTQGQPRIHKALSQTNNRDKLIPM